MAVFPIIQKIGSATTLISSKGGFKSDVGSIITSYASTAAADAEGHISSYAGATIVTSADELYYRNQAANAWIRVLTSSAGVPISSLTAAVATNTISNAAFAQTWDWNTLSSGYGLRLLTTSTAASGGSQILFAAESSGTNSSSGQSTYSAYFSNTHGGTTSTNVAAYFIATGGTTANYAAQFARGKIGIGTTGAESGIVEISGSTSGLITLQPQAAAGTWNWNWPTTAGTLGQALLSGGGGSTAMTWGTVLTGITANNGLTASTSTNVQLGGVLVQNTSISTSAFSLSIESSNSNYTLNVVNSTTATSIFGYNSSTGPGLTASSLGGTALIAYSEASLAGSFQAQYASTNAIEDILTLDRRVAGSGANGIGGGIRFGLETTATAGIFAGRLAYRFTDATAGSPSSSFSISAVASGTTNTVLESAGSGRLILNKYGINTFAGTPAYALGVDASGNVVEFAVSGSVTASNGLSVSGSDVRLGGSALSANSTISTSAFYLDIISTNSARTLGITNNSSEATGIAVTVTEEIATGMTISSSQYYGLTVTSESGVIFTSGSGGLSSSSTSSIAGSFFSTSGVAIQGFVNPSSTNTVVTVLDLIRTSSGTAATGIGTSINFSLEPASILSYTNSNQIISKWSDATVATLTSQFIITGRSGGGSLADLFTINGNGSLRFNTYGAGTITSDASGNITSVSDERLKNISGNYTAGLNEVMKINPILYKWNEKSNLDTENEYAGFSAQNIEEVLGGVATGTNGEGYKSIQDRAIIGMLINAVKSLNEEVKYLKSKN